MFALVDAKDVPAGGFFRRMRRRFSGRMGVSAVYRKILGMKALFVTMEIAGDSVPHGIEKQTRAAAEIMRNAGCEKICFSKFFPYRDDILREGFVEMEDSLLYERLAGRIAMRFSGMDKSAVLFAKRLSYDSERALEALCGSFRYVITNVEAGGRRVIERLEKQYGVSVIERPSAKQLENADTAIFFSAPARKTVLPEGCTAIAVNRQALTGVTCNSVVSGLKLALKNERTLNLPEKFPINTMIAAALEAGTVFPEELRILDVQITGCET